MLGRATLSVGMGVSVGAIVGTIVGAKVGVIAEPDASKAGPPLSAARTVNFLVTVSHIPVAPF